MAPRHLGIATVEEAEIHAAAKGAATVGWLVGTLGVAFVSALIPVVNIETYLVGVTIAKHPDTLTLAAAAAIGQMAGKMLFWLVGSGLLHIRRVAHKGRARGKWAARMERLQKWCEAHWWGPSAVTAVSGLVGIPPFAVWSVLAGSIRMPWWLFLLVGLIGRYARFLAIISAPGLLPGT